MPSPTPTKSSNFIDNLINYFSPSAGLSRAKARLAIQEINRIGERFGGGGYAGAQTTRQTGDWTVTGSDANTVASGSIGRLRERARDLCRNNPHAKRAVQELVGAQIGTGILPRADTGDKSLNAVIDAAWRQWSEECDLEGQLDFPGMEWQLAKAIPESGEVLVRMYRRRANSGLYVPLQIQVLEADFIDTAKTEETATGYIVNGVDFDRQGRRRGYWLFGTHPGASVPTRLGFSSSFVPAMNDDGTPNILHIYLKDRPGQARGITWFSTVITRFRDLDGYEEAVYMRNRLEACIGLVVKSPDGNAVNLGVTTQQSDGKILEELEPGMVAKMRIDEDVTVIDPRPTGGFKDFRTALLQSCAAGLGPMYEQITGDFTGINYSSFRGGQLSFWHVVEAYRWLCLIPMGLRPIWRKFIDSAYLAGRIPTPNYGVRWTGASMPSVDPHKDAQATNQRLSDGTQTWAEAVAERGFDPEEQVEEAARWHAEFDKRDMVWGWDRRKVASNGSVQKDPGSAPQMEESPA